MKQWKRAFKYLYTHKSKVLLLFITVFIVGNLFMSALVIHSSSMNMEALFKNRIKSTVILSDKDVSIDDRLDLYDKEAVAADYYNRLSIYETLVSEYHPLYSSLEVDGSNICLNKPNNSCYYFFGVANSDFFELHENSIEITEGRSFTEEELKNGSPVAVLAKDLGRGNFFENDISNFQVGDIIPFSIISSDGKKVEYPVEIIGLFDISDKLSDENKYPLYFKSFMPYKAVTKQYDIQNELNTQNNPIKYSPVQLTFRLSSDNKMEEFLQRAETLCQSTRLQIFHSDAEFKKVQRPIMAIRSLADKQFMICTIALITIISLLVILFLEERKHEIGIYLALGERKFNIIVQVLLEIITVGMLAILLSIGSGSKLGEVISNKMLEVQIQEDAKSGANELNPEGIDLEKLIEMYDYSIEQDTVLFMMGICFIIILFSATLPCCYFVNIIPRKVLMEDL